jgi:hypothetical protein
MKKRVLVLHTVVAVIVFAKAAFAGNGDLAVNGTIQAGTGGVRFHDGTVQTSASSTKFIPANVQVYNATSTTPTGWQSFSLPSPYNTASAAIVEGSISQGHLYVTDDGDLPGTGTWNSPSLLLKIVSSAPNNSFNGGSKTVPIINGRIWYYFINDGGNSDVYVKIRGVWY